MKKTDLAYVAGIIDGEGCIRIAKRNNGSYFIGVEVGMTNEWIIQWLKFSFGGSICVRDQKGNRKIRYDWSLRTKMARNFLELILPYLKLKRPQAELAIQFQSRRKHRGNPDWKNKPKHTMTESELALDEANRILMRSYNRRGK